MRVRPATLNNLRAKIGPTAHEALRVSRTETTARISWIAGVYCHVVTVEACPKCPPRASRGERNISDHLRITCSKCSLIRAVCACCAGVGDLLVSSVETQLIKRFAVSVISDHEGANKFEG